MGVLPSRDPSQRPAAPPQPDRGLKDAAAVGAGPAGDRQRLPRGLDAAAVGAMLLVGREVGAGPDSCSWAAGNAAKAREAAAGAMAAPSPGPREVLAPSPEAGCRAVTSSRRGLLWRLRDKQSRLGLFEISPGHELHGMTCMMQAGLWAATQVSMDHPPTGPPSRDDFSEVLTQVHEGFELGTLAGPAFAWLRGSLGLAEEDYQAALGPGGPYLQFLSTSKSKASFFLSHDQRFFLKTQGRREVQALLAHLPRYVQHLQRHPHSLLARLLGVHSLRVDRGKKTYFIVMQSVFYPAGRISERAPAELVPPPDGTGYHLPSGAQRAGLQPPDSLPTSPRG
nr:phosphatidylinositol 4-phosphate 5-kinase-like protein 1 isoform X5 [Pan paniscus]